MIALLGALLPGLFKIGDKFIEDKDKRNEFAFKTQAMAFEAMKAMLSTKTYPWVDGLVKLSYAAEQIVKGLIRPIGSFALAGFAAYCSIKGIELPEIIQTLLFGSPVGWGASRHAEKKRKEKQKEENWGDETA